MKIFIGAAVALLVTAIILAFRRRDPKADALKDCIRLRREIEEASDFRKGHCDQGDLWALDKFVKLYNLSHSHKLLDFTPCTQDFRFIAIDARTAFQKALACLKDEDEILAAKEKMEEFSRKYIGNVSALVSHQPFARLVRQ